MRDRAERARRDDREEPAPLRPAPEPDGADPVRRLQDLQREAGNAAVVAALGVQAKLAVGAVHDPAEAEADRIADQVLRNLAATPAAPSGGGVARAVRRKVADGTPASSAPGHGLGGGDVLPETEARIERARGGGQELDPTTRARMEAAFGADLSGVRIHTGGEAASLSRDLNARAFTTGDDVFFGAGEYQPGTAAGDRVLAHELTHTIQQGGGARRVSRLALRGTDWAATQTFTVSSGGANGVGFVDDGSGKLAVKSGEDFPEETTIASNVMNQAVGGETQAPKKKGKKQDGAWSLASPEARALDGGEEAVLKKRLQAILSEREPTDREKKFVDRIGSGGATIVYELASGKDFSEVVSTQAATTGTGKKQKLDPTSVLGQLFTNPAMMMSLGRAGAFDVFIGNGDRLVGFFNTQNFMVDPKTNTITLVDNAAMADEAAFTTTEIKGRSGTFTLEAESGFAAWMGKPFASLFCKGDFQAMATSLTGKMASEFNIAGSVRPEDQPVIMKELQKREKDLQAWFAAGLAEGRNRLLLALNDPLSFVAGVSEEKRLEALTSVYARKFALNGIADPKAAWRMAKANAERVLAAKKRGGEGEAEADERESDDGSARTWVRGKVPLRV